jgi:hypothetical protein
MSAVLMVKSNLDCNTPGVTQDLAQRAHFWPLTLYAKLESEGTKSLEAWLSQVLIITRKEP